MDFYDIFFPGLQPLRMLINSRKKQGPQLPDVFITSHGLVPHVERDAQGRVTRAYGTVRGDMRVQGTRVNRTIREHINRYGAPGDDVGHIIPTCWGGSGRDLDNVFPQNSIKNSGTGFCDRGYARFLAQSGTAIEIDMRFYYQDGNERPYKYTGKITQYMGLLHFGTVEYEEDNTISERSKSEKKKRKQAEKGESTAGGLIKSYMWGFRAISKVFNAAKTTAKASKGVLKFKGATPAALPVALPVALAFDGYRLAEAIYDGNGKRIVKTGAKIGGEWGGGFSGLWAGAALGSAFGPVGTIVGGVVGGIAGTFGGGAAAGAAADHFMEAIDD